MWATMQKLRMRACGIREIWGAEGRKDGKLSGWSVAGSRLHSFNLPSFRPSVLPSFRPSILPPSFRMPRPAGRLSPHDLEMLLVTMIWGGNFSVSKFAMQAIPPLPFSALRFLASSVVLLLVAQRAGVAAPLPRRTLWAIAGLGVLGNTIYQTAFMTGLSMTSATNSAMIVASLPVVVAVRGVHFGAGSLRGDLLVLGSMLCWSLYTLGIRRVGAGVHPLWLTAIATAAGTPGLVLLGLPGALRQDWAAVTPSTWGALSYAAVLSLVLCYVLYNRAVQAIGSGRTALYNCLTPLVAMVIAWLTLGEVPTPVQFVGVALVIGGVLVSVTASTAVPGGVPE